jgi:hypothetical protein
MVDAAAINMIRGAGVSGDLEFEMNIGNCYAVSSESAAVWDGNYLSNFDLN